MYLFLVHFSTYKLFMELLVGRTIEKEVLLKTLRNEDAEMV